MTEQTPSPQDPGAPPPPALEPPARKAAPEEGPPPGYGAADGSPPPPSHGPPPGYPPPPTYGPPPGYPPPPPGYGAPPGYPGAWIPAPVGPVGPIGKTRNPALVVLFAIITLGIYFLVWYYKVNREIRDRDPRVEVRPGFAVLAITLGWLLIFPPFLSLYLTAARLRLMETDETGVGVTDPVLALVIGFLIPGILIPFVGYQFYLQVRLNTFWRSRPGYAGQ